MNEELTDNNVQLRNTATRIPLSIARSEWLWALAFMVSMSLCGLKFPLGYVALLVVMLNRLVRDRYDFMIMLTIFIGRYALVSNSTFIVKPEDIALLLAAISLVICRRNQFMNKALMLTMLYMLGMFLIALTSDELMSVQIRTMRVRWGILYFLVPLMLFANRDFDMPTLMRRVFPYVIIMTFYYVIDGFIFEGWICLPYGMIATDDMLESTFMHPICSPLSMPFPRMYVQGLLLITLVIYPMTRFYKLDKKYWIVAILAMLASRTMTVVAGIVVTYAIFRGHGRKVLMYVLIAIAAIPVVYAVDKGTGGYLRIQSTVDQFYTLGDNMDDEQVAEFASGRGAQVIPKFEALFEQHREWLGFGFLHPDYTKKAKFFINNDLYPDVQKAQEVVTAVEVAPLQTVLDMGFIGLVMQLAFYFGLYYVIRKLKYSGYYLSVLICIFICSISGYSGLNAPDGLMMLGFSLGAVILANKNKASDEEADMQCVS